MEATPQAAPPKRLISAPRVDTAQIPGLDVWQNALSSMTAWNSRALSSVSTLNTGWMEFINHRIEADADHFKRLTACKSPDEWWRLVSGFVEAASHDYQEHLARVAKISSEVVSVPTDPSDPESRRNGPNAARPGSRNH
jgi:Phasin protein